jgi:hypothetical protein
MAWETNGNANTNSRTDFVGTTDDQPLSLRTNSKEAVRIDPAGMVGIGTPQAQNLLHVGPGTTSISANRVNAVFASNTPDAGIAIEQNGGVNILLQASGGGAFIGTTSKHSLLFRTADLDRVEIDSFGNVRMTGQLAVAGDVIITGKLNHGGFDALQQISALKEQLSSVQNEASSALNLIQGLANFDGTLQARIATLEQQVFGLQQDVAGLQSKT